MQFSVVAVRTRTSIFHFIIHGAKMLLCKDNRYLLYEYRRACKKEGNILDKIETTIRRLKKLYRSPDVDLTYVITAPLQNKYEQDATCPHLEKKG